MKWDKKAKRNKRDYTFKELYMSFFNSNKDYNIIRLVNILFVKLKSVTFL